MADKNKHASTMNPADTPKPKKKKAKKGKNKGVVAGENAGQAEPDYTATAPARTAAGKDIDAKAKERIAAAASAAAAQLAETQPTALSALLGDETDRVAEPRRSDATVADETVVDRFEITAPGAGVESTATETRQSGFEPQVEPQPETATRPTSTKESDRAEDDEAADPVASESSAVESPAPVSSGRRSAAGRWPTLLILMLLAVAVFFYIRAILPIRTVEDQQATGLVNTVSPVGVGKPLDRPGPVPGLATPTEPGIDPSLIEALAKHLPGSPTESTPATPDLKPLPSEQLDLINQVFAPELGGADSSPQAASEP